MAKDFVPNEGINYPSYSGAEPLSLACWFNADDVASHYVIHGVGDSAGSHYFSIRLRGDEASDLIGAFAFDGGAVPAMTTAGFTAGTWHHAAATFPGGGVQNCWIDGGSKGTHDDNRTPAAPDRVAVGVSADGTPFGYFDGQLAEAAVWGAELTDAEVLMLSLGYSPLFVRPESLLFYAPLIRESIDRVGGLTPSDIGTPTVTVHPPKIIYPAPKFLSFPVPAAVGTILPQMVQHHGG